MPLSLFVNPLSERRQDIAMAAIAHLLDIDPELNRQCGPNGLKHCLDETAELVLHLSHSIATDMPLLLQDHVAWLRVVWSHAELPDETLPALLKALAAVVPDFVASSLAAKATRHIEEALHEYDAAPNTPSSYIDERDPLGKRARRFLRALLTLQRDEAAALVEDATRTGTPVVDIYLRLFQPVLYEVGRLWQTNKVSVATEHYCATIVELLMDQLQAQMPRAQRENGSALIGCAPGELHELGARMVSHMLQAHGWDTIYLGANVPSQGIVDTLQQSQARVLCLSMSMAMHVGETARLIAAVRQAMAGRHVPIVMGGLVMNRVPGLWQRLGADACAADASQAIAVCRTLAASPT